MLYAFCSDLNRFPSYYKLSALLLVQNMAQITSVSHSRSRKMWLWNTIGKFKGTVSWWRKAKGSQHLKYLDDSQIFGAHLLFLSFHVVINGAKKASLIGFVMKQPFIFLPFKVTLKWGVIKYANKFLITYRFWKLCCYLFADSNRTYFAFCTLFSLWTRWSRHAISSRITLK